MLRSLRRIDLLIAVVFIGSALCWWPLAIEPSLDLPPWIPLVIVAFVTGVCTVLSRGGWLRFAVAATAGTFVGLLSAAFIFPPSDPIAATYSLYVVAIGTGVVGVVALIVAAVSRRLSVSNRNLRRVLWASLLCCVAFGPVALALTPPLVARRIARNDALAFLRFLALKAAVEGSHPVCDGQVLKQHYSGPPFSEEDWRRITGNYVTEDGYFFMVYCHEKGGYTIDAHAAGTMGYGTRKFCTDETRKVSCGMAWNRSRYACTACAT